MADINDVIQKLRDTANELEVGIPVLLLDSVTTAKSVIQNRIQETGKDHKGKQLGEYSQKKIPVFFNKNGKTVGAFLGRGRKTTDAKLLKAAREKKPISYADFRAMDGKQNKYVDLTLSGITWRQTGLVDKGQQGNKSVAVLGQTTDRSKKIAGYLQKQYGNYLQLSEHELEIVTDDVALGLEEIINRNLSGL